MYAPDEERRGADGLIGPGNVLVRVPAEKWQRLASALRLSPGQADYLRYSLRDPRDVRVAECMRISVHGAHAHRRAMFRRLGVHSIAEAFAVVFGKYIELENDGNEARGPCSQSDR